MRIYDKIKSLKCRSEMNFSKSISRSKDKLAGDDSRGHHIHHFIDLYLSGYHIYRRECYSDNVSCLPIFDPHKSADDQIAIAFKNYRSVTYACSAITDNKYYIRWSDEEWILVKLMSEVSGLEYRNCLLAQISKCILGATR